MLNIKELTIRNFLSVGNVTQSVNFDRPGITLVMGENMDVGGNSSKNGAGKSSITQALSFALFGLPITSIKKDNLINKTNQKGMIVSLTFEKDGKKYRIERGRKPNILKWYVDDKAVNSPDADEAQGESKWTQAEIERVLGFNHEIFQHLVVLSTEIIPFLKLPAKDQRSIIENLLGITALSEKAEILKGLIRDTKDAMTREEIRLKSITDSNMKIQQTIDDLEKKSAKWDRDHMDTLQDIERQLTELLDLNIDAEISNHEKKAELTSLTATLKQLSSSQKSLEGQIVSNATLLESLTVDLEAVKAKSCPTCGSELHDNHDSILENISGREQEMNERIIQTGNELESIIVQKEGVQKAIEALGKPVTKYPTLDAAYQHRATVERLEAALVRESEMVNPFRDQIATLLKEGLQVVDYEIMNELASKRDHQEFLLKLLTNKDSFIRKKIIDQNLQYMNHRLSTHLEKFSFPHTVRFLNDLSVDISLMGRDMDYDNLSSGERKRVILALSFAFRDVWESLNQTLNLLFLDEQLDNGTDGTAIDAAWAIMNTYSRDRGKSVFLISHREELVNKATTLMKVVKHGGFTTIHAPD